MEDYQERVVVERNELNTKLQLLLNFMHTDVFANMHSADQGLLMIQQVVMQNYIDVLTRRIDIFQGEDL